MFFALIAFKKYFNIKKAKYFSNLLVTCQLTALRDE